MEKISPYVSALGMNIRIDKYLDLFQVNAWFSVKKVPFKRDLRYWNDSPWSMQPLKAVHCEKREGREYIDLGVYQIWERKDGCGMEVEYFATKAEYDAYNPSGESPDAIKLEIGLCENYHTGL